MAKNTGQIKPTKGMPKEPISGPVPQHHRLRLGEGDGESNPNGVGNPSTKSTISNGGKQGW